MARAARYGNIQPDVFESLDAHVAVDLAMRVMEMYVEDEKRRFEFDVECTKAIVKATGASVL